MPQAPSVLSQASRPVALALDDAPTRGNLSKPGNAVAQVGSLKILSQQLTGK